jgi:hypothetical protein
MFRYYTLLESAITPDMVADITDETLKGVYRFVPTSLRTGFPLATSHFLEVHFSEHNVYLIYS